LNHGIELVFAGDLIRAKTPAGLGLNAMLNVAFNRNKVTSLYHNEGFSEGERDINRVEVGHPIGEFYGYQFVGVDPDSGNALYRNAAGQSVTFDQLTTADQTFIGNPYPNFVGGFTTTVTWNRFDFRAFFPFSQGNKVFNAVRIFSGSGGRFFDNEYADQFNYWRKPGDVTDVPRPSHAGNSGARVISSRFIEDGSYFRLQDLTLGYNLPISLMKSTGFHDARIYVTGHNLFTITKYKGYDPDVNSNGNFDNVSIGTDFYAYPTARTFSFGFQAGW
jgi:hypothetical protein